MLVLST